MRAAPPVDAALDAARFERMLITLLHAGVGALLSVWLALHAEWPTGAPLLVCALLASVGMATVGARLAQRALPAAPGRLRWDGQAWTSQGGHRAEPLSRLVVAIDLGSWMLLQLHPADGGRVWWRVASHAAAQGSWHGLRVALAAHAGAPGQVTR